MHGKDERNSREAIGCKVFSGINLGIAAPVLNLSAGVNAVSQSLKQTQMGGSEREQDGCGFASDHSQV